jgi:hypothetical protein
MPAVEERIVALDEILEPWQPRLGNDFAGYRNHVYRVVNFCFALRECTEAERRKIIIAGCFHDLGIWSGKTFDYLPPSIALANGYIEQNGLDHWAAEIELMIRMHHKLRPYKDRHFPLVEVFRKGDLVDFSRGIVTCGISRTYVREVTARFPNAGFHRRLVLLELAWLPRHPLRPLPVVKW